MLSYSFPDEHRQPAQTLHAPLSLDVKAVSILFNEYHCSMVSYTCRHRNQVYSKFTKQLLSWEVPFMVLIPSNSFRFSLEEEFISSFLTSSPELILTRSKPAQRQFLDTFTRCLSST